MSRGLKKWLKRFILFIATLVLLLLSTFTWILFDPQGAWDLVGRRFVPKDLQVEWQELNFSPVRVSGWTWQGTLEVKGLRIKKANPQFSVNTDRLFFRYTLTLFRPHTHLRVHELDLISVGGFLQTSPPKEPSQELNPYQWSELIFGRLDLFNEYFSLERMSLEVTQFELRGAGDPIVLSGLVSKALGAKSDPLKIQSLITRGQLKIASQIELLPRTSDSITPLVTGFVEVKKDTPQDGRLDAKLNVTIQPSTDIVRIAAHGPIRYGKVAIDPTAELRISRGDWSLDIHGNIEGLLRPFQKVTGVRLRLTTPMRRDQWLAPLPSGIEASASLGLLLVKPELRKTLNRLCRCEWPERRAVVANGKVWLKPLLEPRPERDLLLDAAISSEKTSNALLDLDLAGQIRIYSENGRYDLVPAVNSSLKIKSFQAAREILQSHGVLIPAPLDTLEGIIWVRAKSPLKFNPDFSETDVNFEVDLKSEKQIAKLNGQAGLKLKSKQRVLDVSLGLDIQKVLLELPPLDPILGIPRLALDSRVQLKPTKRPGKKSAFRVNLTLAAHTLEPGALRFLSPLAEPHVPISIEAKRTTEGDLVGFLRAEPFRIRYLKRVVYVEQLRVVFDQREDADFSLDGRVRVDATQYKVWADISGTLRNPSVRLRSEPDLSRSDIISVLLYDRVSDQLVSADRETASSFEAALLDRAIGLFGLWAFASTPIRSFQYNPVTRVYTATVLLAGGVTAGIGTNWESSAQFELRKRVSRQWVLSASWAPGELESQVGKLVLQWERRF